jgi:sec-independent protein translocase protein TatA
MFGHWEILIVLVIILVIFGAGKLPGVMGDLGKGIGAFKKGMSDKDNDEVKKEEAIEAPKKAVKKAPAKKKSVAKKVAKK